ALVLDHLDDALVEILLAHAPVRLGVALGVLDDRAGHVDAARALDPLEPGRAVDLEDLRPVLALEHVDAGDLQAHRLCRADGDAPVRAREIHRVALDAAVEVRAELP